MTTHDQQANTTPSTSTADVAHAEPESSSAGTEASTARTAPPVPLDNPPRATEGSDSSLAQGEMLTEGDEQSMARTEEEESDRATRSEPPGMGTRETGPSANESLLAADDLSGLRSRWDDVQAAFVDDPQECVQRADALVAEVVEQLTTGFSEARSRLEAQWARGEEASTEDLRLALKRYREFFQRLLAA